MGEYTLEGDGAYPEARVGYEGTYFYMNCFACGAPRPAWLFPRVADLYELSLLAQWFELSMPYAVLRLLDAHQRERPVGLEPADRVYRRLNSGGRRMAKVIEVREEEALIRIVGHADEWVRSDDLELNPYWVNSYEEEIQNFIEAVSTASEAAAKTDGPRVFMGPRLPTPEEFDRDSEILDRLFRDSLRTTVAVDD